MEQQNTMRSVLIAILALLAVAAAVIFTVSALSPTISRTDEGQENRITMQTAGNRDDVPAGQDGTLSRSKVGWGIGPAANEKGQPNDAVNAQREYEELGGYFIFPDDDNTLYLTFDLGYENGYTPKILDVLADKGVKATFFITMDYVDEAPDVVQRIIDEGHTLANHTANHPSVPDVSDDRAREELMELHRHIEEQYGCDMKLFRYPKGEFSEHTLKLIDDIGYKSIFWSFAYKDWVVEAQPDPTASLAKLVDALHPGGIYLLHAVSSTNTAILGDFIEAAWEEGYTFGLVDERLGLVERAEPPEPSIL